jgi:urease accessory protein
MNSRNRLLTFASVCAACMLPATAMAHSGHGISQDFVAGVLHPLSGLDHVLMVLAVGAWAALLSLTGRVVVAACLTLFVAIGAVLPVPQESGPLIEVAIALTVIGAGMLLALGRRWPMWAAGAAAALFAMIHGLVHGTEGPAGSIAYVPGLALATGSFALVVSCLAARMQSQRGWLRVAGGLGAALGASALITAA